LQTFPLRKSHFLIAALLSSCLVSLSVTAQDIDESTYELNTLQKKMKESEARGLEIRREAESVAEETSSIRRKLVGFAARVQERESDVSEAEAELIRLANLEKEKTDQLTQNSEALIETLAALQILQTNPPPALFVHPDDATDAARAAILLAEIAPTLKAQADALAIEIDEVRLAKEAVIHQRATLSRADTDLEADRAKLRKVLAEREEKYAKLTNLASAEKQTLGGLAKQARSIEELIAGIRRLSGRVTPRRKPDLDFLDQPVPQPRRSPFDTVPTGDNTLVAKADLGKELRSAPLQSSAGLKVARFSAAKGSVRLPANGRMIATFGGEAGTGGKTKGITIATRPGAQVVAPFDGEIAFAGPYLGYGELLIITAGQGYHLILSGMDRIDGVTGQRLLAGEPIGQMGPTQVISSSSGSKSGKKTNSNPQGWPELYFELRKDGHPFDPVPWLALKTTKTKG
jgi:septal ring factor EnvC (AmiA/AmiB activator)